MIGNPLYFPFHRKLLIYVLSVGLCFVAGLFPARAHIVEDSLRLVLARKDLPVQEQVMAMGKLARIIYYRKDQKEAYTILGKAIQLSEKLEDGEYKAYLYAILAGQYADDQEFLRSKNSLDSALYYSSRTRNNTIRGYVQYTRGRINLRDNKFREAIAGFLEGLRLTEKEKAYAYKSSIYAGMADIYSQWADTHNEEKYAGLCWSEAVKSNDPDIQTAAAHSKANSFINRYKKDTSRQIMLDSALYYYKYSISVLKKNRDRVVHLTRLPVAAYNLAKVHLKEMPVSRKDTVLNYLDTAIEEGIKTGANRVLARSYLMLAEYAIAEEDYGRADLLIGNAIMAIHQEPAEDHGIKALISWYYSLIREKQGNVKEALRYYKQYIAEYTSLFDLEKMTLAQKLEAQYEASRKERELAVLQEKIIYGKKLNQLYIGLALVGFIAVIILVYANKQRTRAMKQQKQLHKMEVSKIEQKSRISLLSAMLEGQEQERSRLARDLHDGLGGLLSGIKIEMSTIKTVLIKAESRELMNKTMEHLDDAVNELRRIAHSMMPEILIRYGLGEAIREYCQRLRTSGVNIECQVFHYTNDMDHSRQMVLYRIMQELANNAMKHARASLIYVQLQQVEDKIFLTVEDDGIGFDKGEIKAKQSAGWTNIRARVEFLGGNLDVLSEKGSGTTVTVECSMAHE
ncbi:sensor histidine kinase [Sinomicrobium weinanense]|uniref:Sensor histidine kinase n=1 Tax=Sinomicrobium weinanense TaxID=2842200 RepID=A0A926JQI5_9FLAO|nr:sensor histidine kinase [Sinomicrobium weinanense]MBC9795635.1 sensor histidine kinase [Sinomicrobium weinanense]MBU3124656.1 sensor histidine kinase [Sinomicrobium weinanense]